MSFRCSVHKVVTCRHLNGWFDAFRGWHWDALLACFLWSRCPMPAATSFLMKESKQKHKLLKLLHSTLLSHMTFAGPSLGCNHRLRSGALCSEGHSFEQEVSNRIASLWTDIHPCLSVFKARLFCVSFVFRGLAFSSLAPSYWTR